jgi:O-acetyl-ADP-ribose deacetylase (regulator of RNase III)
MLREVDGDLIHLALQGEFDAIVHGCNCFRTMGAGIARQIKAAFPEAWAADRATIKGDPSKLGSFSSALSRGILVINAYTQFDYRGRGVKADYHAIRQCMSQIAAAHPSLRIGIPRIGAGLAGGDWPTIHSILSEVFHDRDVTIVNYQPPPEPD